MTVNRGPDPGWWADWRQGESAMAAQQRHAAQAYASQTKVEKADLSTIDEEWKKRLLFVMHRRPDAVASR